ncbi:MAG: hypothetical protein CO061_04060 [Candidatus Yonathbacteria bacterium CG_4_9_14_0_2_um_filter_47_74]|nr:MAG: hypothetical protein CO061_04060 [Candidatus Yonathbacteria bacterium CG_4_9_14_0_2_um_filter_47_74]
MTVERLIRSAPISGRKKNPANANTPVATGIAITLYSSAVLPRLYFVSCVFEENKRKTKDDRRNRKTNPFLKCHYWKPEKTCNCLIGERKRNEEDRNDEETAQKHFRGAVSYEVVRGVMDMVHTVTVMFVTVFVVAMVHFRIAACTRGMDRL